MNVDELVVITYPRHILISGVVVREAIRLQKWNKPVTIIYDDLFEQSYTTFKDDLQWTLERSNPGTLFKFIPFSEFNFLHNIHLNDIPMKRGWLRQQFVKVLLDDVLISDSWFIIDGDCILTDTVKDDVIPYIKNCKIGGLTEKFKQYWDFIYQKTAGHMVYTNAVPFRFISRKLLVAMRDYISTLHCRDFKDIHEDLLKEGIMTLGTDSMIMSEWDIIEYYRLHILQHESNVLTPYNLNMLPNNIVDDTSNSFDILYGEDADLGKKWFESHGIHITDAEFKNIIKNWMPLVETNDCITVSDLMHKWNSNNE